MLTGASYYTLLSIVNSVAEFALPKSSSRRKRATHRDVGQENELRIIVRESEIYSCILKIASVKVSTVPISIREEDCIL